MEKKQSSNGIDYSKKGEKKKNNKKSRSRSHRKEYIVSKTSKKRSRTRSKDRKTRDKSKKRRRSDSHSSPSKSKSPKQLYKIEERDELKENRLKRSNFTDNCPNPDSQYLSNNMGGQIQSIHALALVQAGKVDRKLYIGNLPTGITSSTLVKLLNAALIALKANITPGDPVLSAWISTDGHYAFVEFRTAEEANNGFTLNNISILGQPLKVGRPKTYVGSLSMLDDGSLCNTVAAALQSGTMNTPLMGRKVQFPTRVLCFKNIVSPSEIDEDEEFKEIIDDIREECNKFGRVMSINIPRTEVDREVIGIGHAFVEFYTLEESKEARRQMSGRKFNRKSVKLIYFSEEKYTKKDFSVVDETQIIN